MNRSAVRLIRRLHEGKLKARPTPRRSARHKTPTIARMFACGYMADASRFRQLGGPGEAQATQLLDQSLPR
jgi:hypothetical protein